MKDRPHCRDVFKSDHLSASDLEKLKESGHNMIFTIKEVKRELNAKVAGRFIDANIAYFKESIKPMVLNSENTATVRSFAGDSGWLDEWKNITVELYVKQKVKSVAGGYTIGCYIKKRQPIITPKAPPTLEGAQWEKAVAAITAKTYTAAQIEAAYSLTDAQKTQINGL